MAALVVARGCYGVLELTFKVFPFPLTPLLLCLRSDAENQRQGEATGLAIAKVDSEVLIPLPPSPKGWEHLSG